MSKKPYPTLYVQAKTKKGHDTIKSITKYGGSKWRAAFGVKTKDYAAAQANVLNFLRTKKILQSPTNPINIMDVANKLKSYGLNANSAVRLSKKVDKEGLLPQQLLNSQKNLKDLKTFASYTPSSLSINSLSLVDYLNLKKPSTSVNNVITKARKEVFSNLMQQHEAYKNLTQEKQQTYRNNRTRNRAEQRDMNFKYKQEKKAARDARKTQAAENAIAAKQRMEEMWKTAADKFAKATGEHGDSYA